MRGLTHTCETKYKKKRERNEYEKEKWLRDIRRHNKNNGRVWDNPACSSCIFATCRVL